MQAPDGTGTAVDPAPAREAEDGLRAHAGPAGTGTAGTRNGLGRIEDQERDELAALICRAQARAGQEQADAVRARRLPAAMRLDYDEAVWAARNPRLAGQPEAQRRDAYYSYRYHRWLEDNAGWMAEVPDAGRHERFRSDESWWRYRNHLPPLDDQERAAFREWAELDADDAEQAYIYRLLPERLYDAYDGSQGPLNWDSFYAQYLHQLHHDEPDPAAAGTSSHATGAQGAPVGPGAQLAPADGTLSRSEATSRSAAYPDDHPAGRPYDTRSGGPGTAGEHEPADGAARAGDYGRPPPVPGADGPVPAP
jgi:hypothetical protein